MVCGAVYTFMVPPLFCEDVFSVLLQSKVRSTYHSLQWEFKISERYELVDFEREKEREPSRKGER